ncbi:MAG: transglutaminase-like domain-containing protein [Bacteroidales bacterium]
MLRIISFIAVFALFTQCAPENVFQKDKTLILNAFEQGEYTIATELINKSLNRFGLQKDQKNWLTIRQAMMDRTRLDFSKSEEQIKTQLSKYYPALPDNLINSWESSGHLEMRRIDGVKKYFKYAVSNLFRLDSDAAKIRQNQTGISVDPLDSIRIENTSVIIKDGKPGTPVESRLITIEYSITVDADAVPAGEEVFCWMPFPRESGPRQKNVILISSNPDKAVRSTPDCLHSSLYAIKKAVAGIPTVFSYKAFFEISGQWFRPTDIESGKTEKTGPDIEKYTREKPPHIAFTQLVRQLADSLSTTETNPFKIIRSFYHWIDKNIPWASALEYSTFECIPDYVIKHGHGDCGMKTFLLMSMARYKGIPARWQSGWMLHPGEENLHDWCELWFAKTGWVPVDMSFGLQKTEDLTLKEFYLSGIDSYRMIVNDGFAEEFYPPKKFYRSEPFDFQRGEVEWSKGNLYFNQWDYKLNVVSIAKKNQ